MQRRLPEILEDADNGLSERFRAELHGLAEELRHLNERVAHYDAQIDAIAHGDRQARDLMTIPGIGPKGATALLAAVGEDATLFSNGRGLAAWIGLVPRQHSTGGRDRLLDISKRGDVYLRNLLIHGARAVLRTLEHKEDRTSRWAKALTARRHTNVAIVAMANKMARVAYAVMTTGKPYDPAIGTVATD
jgi:transposase